MRGREGGPNMRIHNIFMLNLLSEDLQANLVSSCPLRSPVSMKSPSLSVKSPSLSKGSLNPALTSRSPTPSRLCWFHMKHGEKANNCRKPFSFLGNEQSGR